jgi:hypothetical protein
VLLLVLLFLLVMPVCIICPPPQEEAARALLGLSIALDHPALSSSPQVLCAAARSCKAWGEAVQQCSVRNTAVVLDPRKPLQQLHSFSQWLPKHAALVQSITATTETAAIRSIARLSSVRGPSDSHLEAAQQLLQQALQGAANAPKSGAAAAAVAAPRACALLAAGAEGLPTASAHQTVTMQEQQQQQPGWRLASFSSDLPAAPALLHVLPAHSLTHLHLHLHGSAAARRASAGLSHLARLSSLQHLHLHSSNAMYELPVGCLAGLAQLSQLTSLRLSGI